MALFEFLKKAQEKVDALQKKAENFVVHIEEDPIKALSEMKGKHTSKPKPHKPDATAKRIAAMFYSDYPEIPYISIGRGEQWVKMAQEMPKTVLVQRNMMARFNDGLLPGHIYMLYWLNKYTNKKVPQYFEYKYGIDFHSEKSFLLDTGYLDSMDKPTEKGMGAIANHTDVIENHSPKPDRSIDGISKRILAARDSLIRNGCTEYEFMANRDCCSVCARLNGKHFPIEKLKIGVNAPPMHEECRCAIAPYVDRREYERWLNFTANGGTTAEWEKLKKKKK